MGLFDGLDDIEKIGGLEAANEQLKKDVVDWIMKTYFNDNSDIVCEIGESNGWFRVMQNGTLIITGYAGDYEKLSIKVDDGNYKYATKEFVDKVKKICENKVKPSLVDINEELQQKLFFLLSDIPIHFGKQKDYEDYDDGQYLGLYCNKNNQREIILFEDAIMSVVNGNEEYLEGLIWKVIIHEYAHAMMDTLQCDKLRQQDPKLYKYREESLANAFALKVLEKNIDDFNKIESFVKSQSEEYRHGLEIYKREDLLKMIEFWREMKISALGY